MTATPPSRTSVSTSACVSAFVPMLPAISRETALSGTVKRRVPSPVPWARWARGTKACLQAVSKRTSAAVRARSFEIASAAYPELLL